MTPMLRAVGLAVGLTLSRCSEDVSTGDDADYWDDDSYGFSVAEGFCAFQCDPAYLGDGECDDMCNVEACDWDGTDCFHGYGECYSHPDGSDYRGALNHTESGYPCQKWSAQWPQRHTRIHTNFPHAGLGGHSSCRNPDNEARPWCYTTAPETRWEYCEIPPLQPSCHHNPSHSREAPSAARPLDEAGSGDTERNPYNLSFYGFDYYSSYDIFPSVVFERDIVKALPLNKLIHGQLDEHTYVFYEVEIPRSVELIKAVVVPGEGDPDLYVSFDNPFPTGANYTFLSDNYGVEEVTLGRYNYLFCGAAGVEASCTLHLSILAYDEYTTFSLVVYGVEDPTAEDAPSLQCAPGCEWPSIGDGTCNQQCNVEACFSDRGDCEVSTGHERVREPG
ncbi:hypothetical protein EMIHUDRAFT_247657 [Emiliania huxleyi CCMP1516]|uniref:Kringle domain-containing protein n=2 Tax=Emiliania huxleyi TaxID=2903 RepID=A0A0D3IL60_EMIH1|nr:hypothetical protein EMIHUDRAFT_247657 [Emiliania huxleyi CCMP1516]EOD11995.1 hypothetical protein EMIHUDRAFT_247657 [Emiliania huxleyi CCMP1516]|eukprot:XP_005764424.1 hypothetical protein EMIHUDRAFT_247657 [Emiliania huxleyi CCMP1516]